MSHLQASRIALLFIFIALLAAFSAAAEEYTGPSTIETDHTIEGGDYIMDSNITVSAAGNLTVVNATFTMANGSDEPYLFNVAGRLAISNCTLTGDLFGVGIFSKNGTVVADRLIVSSFFSGIYSKGDLELSNSTVSGCNYGVYSQDGTALVRSSRLIRNTYGLQTEGSEVVANDSEIFSNKFWNIRASTSQLNMTGGLIKEGGDGILLRFSDAFLDSVEFHDVSETNCEAGCQGPTVHGAGIYTYYSDVEVVDLLMINLTYGILSEYSHLDIFDSVFRESQWGVHSTYSSGSVTNSTFSDDDTGIEMRYQLLRYSGNNHTDVGVEIVQYWKLVIQVTDEYAFNLKDVDIIMVDNTGTEVTYRTNHHGQKELTIAEYEQNAGIVTRYAPFAIKLQKDGYQMVTGLHNITLNKELNFTFDVPRADIYIERFDLKDRLSAGERKLIVWVGNQGDRAAANVTVTFMAILEGGQEEIIGTGFISSLAMNETKTSSVTWTPTKGTYTVSVVADIEEDEIDQSNATNNHVSVSTEIFQDDEDINTAFWLSVVAGIFMFLVVSVIWFKPTRGK